MALDYNDLAVFLRVAREGSFAAAAQRLAMPTSTVSRRVAALEAQLGVQLLRRTTRAVSLTDDGQAYAKRCAGFMEEINAATGALLDRGGQVLRGTLRVRYLFWLALNSSDHGFWISRRCIPVCGSNWC